MCVTVGTRERTVQDELTSPKLPVVRSLAPSRVGRYPLGDRNADVIIILNVPKLAIQQMLTLNPK
jgi:hypothetical protein